MIEAYPLAGVLGTILAIGAALQSGQGDAQQTVADIVRYFGDAIWSTFVGLIAAMILMFVNSVVETKFQRLAENRLHVREIVARTKRELSIAAGGHG
jgi:biopolymer transport protein ExbB/TolQ